MQELIAAIFGSTADTSSATPDTREYIENLVTRAYYNLHGSALQQADAVWASAMLATCMQLYKDPRIANLSSRELLQCFENVMRVSDEHQKISKRHAAMAMNVFYLKETVLDALDNFGTGRPIQTASTTVISSETSYTGRVSIRPLPQSN